MLVVRMAVRLTVWVVGIAIRVAALVVAALAAVTARAVFGAATLAVAGARRAGDALAAAKTKVQAARAVRCAESGQRSRAEARR